MEDLIIGGAIESNRESDYGMAGGLEIVPSVLHRFEDHKIQYDQKTNDPYGCTRYGVMTAIANNWGIQRTDADFLYMRTTAPSYGRAPKLGMLLSKAGDMVVDYLNKKDPTAGRQKLAISLYDEGDSYMQKGYMLQVGSIVNSVYFGFTHTGDITDTWGKEGMGHCRTLFYHQAYPARGEVENYVGVLDHNVIDISCRDKIVQETQYYRQGFIYFPTNAIMPPITIEYDHGTTPSQQEIVKARETEIQHGYKPHFTNYMDEYYITRMLIDIDRARSV